MNLKNNWMWIVSFIIAQIYCLIGIIDEDPSCILIGISLHCGSVIGLWLRNLDKKRKRNIKVIIQVGENKMEYRKCPDCGNRTPKLTLEIPDSCYCRNCGSYLG